MLMIRRRTTDILSVAFIVYGIIFQILVGYSSFKYINSLTAAFIIIILSISIALLGFKKNVNTNIKKSIFNITLIFVLAYFVITYTIGFIFGFNKNAYSMELSGIISNIISPIIVVISIELIRYLYIENNKFSKDSIWFIVFALTIFEICINVRLIDFNSIRVIFVNGTTIILPIITKNIVFSYITYHGGYRPTILYRLFMDLYIYILPIIPAFNDYMTSVIGVLYPMLLYVYVSRIIDEYYNNYEYEFSSNKFHLVDGIYIILIIICVALVSGKAPYSVMAVGSNSMAPYMNRGDAVILKNVKSKNDIKVNNVIAFKNEDRIVIHRLIEIKNKKGKTYYITQGDANNSADDIDVNYKDIIGIVKFNIKYVAYPTVYFNDLLSKRS